MLGHYGFEDRARHQTRNASAVTLGQGLQRRRRPACAHLGFVHDDSAPGSPPHPVRRRRRLCLQGAARRARAGAGRPAARRARRAATCSSGSSTATTAPSYASTADRAVVSRPPTSSPRSSTTPTTGAGSRRPTPSPTSTRWAASRCVAVNLLAWPRDRIPFELAAEVLRGGSGRLRRRPAATSPAGTASTTPSRSTAWPSPGSPTPSELLRNDAGAPGLPLTLTKPLGLGVLNNRHKATGEVFPRGGRHDDHAQPGRLPGGRRGRGRVRHRRHRLRPARPPATSCAGPAGSPP